MARPPQCYYRGLTILELLVVIVIVLILASLIYPVIQGMVERSRIVNCATNMRSLGSVLQAWRADHDGYFPTGIDGKRLLDPITDENPDPQKGASVTKALIDDGYLKESETPLCPALRLSAKGKAILRPGKTAKDRLKEFGSYNLNVFLVQVKPEALYDQDLWRNGPYPGNSKMPFLAESHSGIGGGYSGFIWSEGQYTTALDGVDYGTSINVKGRNHGAHRLNFMFLDGHIAPLAPKITADGIRVWNAATATLNDPEIPFDSWGRNGKYIGAKRLR